MLIGSDLYSSHITADGQEYQLGHFVQQAFSRARMTEDEWNDLHEDIRDKLIRDEMDRSFSAYDLLKNAKLSIDALEARLYDVPDPIGDIDKIIHELKTAQEKIRDDRIKSLL